MVMVDLTSMNTKILEQTIKRLDERLGKLESWRSPKSQIDILVDQSAHNNQIHDMRKINDILKRTVGSVSKKKANTWLKWLKTSQTKKPPE